MSTQSKCQSILVVDDDEGLRSMIIEFLEIEGFKAQPAMNGKDALQIINSGFRPCLVLLDLMMPVMNGMEFLKNVQQNSDLASLKILVVSANASDSNTQGAIGYVTKPVDLDFLLKTVQTYCSCT